MADDQLDRTAEVYDRAMRGYYGCMGAHFETEEDKDATTELVVKTCRQELVRLIVAHLMAARDSARKTSLSIGEFANDRTLHEIIGDDTATQLLKDAGLLGKNADELDGEADMSWITYSVGRALDALYGPEDPIRINMYGGGTILFVSLKSMTP